MSKQYNPDNGLHVKFENDVNFYPSQTTIEKLVVKGIGFLKNGFKPKQFYTEGDVTIRTKDLTITVNQKDGTVKIGDVIFNG